MCLVSELSFSTPDGVILHGQHFDATHAGDPLELAVFIAHGFTGSHEKAHVKAIAEWLRSFAGVVTLTFRGHGRSGGEATFGHAEMEDMNIVIRHLRGLGYKKVVTVGWSMGSGNAILQAAAVTDGPAAVDAVVSVSGASRWYLRDTRAMRRVQWVINRPAGRFVARTVLRTRIATDGWGDWGPDGERVAAPPHPWQAIAEISPRPVLVVHGDADVYFGLEHGEVLYDAAKEPKTSMFVAGYGHAETAATKELVERIGAWVRESVGLPPVEVRGTISA